MSIQLKDRLDRSFTLNVNNGDRIYNVLSRNSIPVDSVFVRKDDDVIDDYDEVYDEKHDYIIEMVRAYHLPDFLSYLNLWDFDNNTHRPSDNSFYTKRFALHSPEDGDFNYFLSHFKQDDFVKYIEDLFVDGCKDAELINQDEDILLALSGGRDSLSLGYFLSRNKNRLPNFNISAVHVETSSNKLETGYATDIAKMFDFPIRVYTNDEVTKIYNLKTNIQDALLKLKNNFNRSYSIFSAHNVIKACVEKHARSVNVNKIIYGLMKEDVSASILKGMFVGQPFRGPLLRNYGDFKLIYPLWPVSKKELTLYLEAINKAHNKQGSPSTFERGALSRDIYYFMIDTLETICPGISYQLMEATKISTANSLKPIKYKTCQNCGTTYSADYEAPAERTFERKEGLCDLCNMFDHLNLLK